MVDGKTTTITACLTTDSTTTVAVHTYHHAHGYNVVWFHNLLVVHFHHACPSLPYQRQRDWQAMYKFVKISFASIKANREETLAPLCVSIKVLIPKAFKL